MKAVLLLGLALAATAAEAASFKDLCEKFEPFRKFSDLKYVKPEVTIEPKTPGVKPQDVVFTIEAKSGTIKVAAGPDGVIDLPFSDKLCAEDPDFETNQPKGTVNIDVSIDPKVPPVQTFDYRLLESLRAEWKVAVGRQSLMYRLRAPSSKAYQVNFEPGKGGTAEIRLPGGVRKLTANEKGELRIPFDDSWIAANPTIVLSEMPKRIGLAFD